MKQWKYILILALSFAATASVFIKACDCVAPFWRIFCDFIAMIGSGVFCSTIVSWFFEMQSKAKEKRDREEQKKFVFASVKNSFSRLLERELVEASEYYAKYFSEKDVPYCKEKNTLSQIGEKLVWLFEQFETAENVEQSAEILTITVESMKQDEEKQKRLVTNNAIYYKLMFRALSELSSYYNTCFIAGLITEEQVEVLKDLAWDVDIISICEPEIGVDDGSVLVFKRMLFEKTKDYISALNISTSECTEIRCKNIF